jgi:hypothetical protein
MMPSLIGSDTRKRNGLIQRWNALTAIPEAPPEASFVKREASRKSKMTSDVLFFFTVMVFFLLPACYISPYISYFWLDLGLFAACIVALILNRGGHTLTAGIVVNVAAFAALTLALLTTVPFDETTLQGYDMYVVFELLAVSLLPTGSVFIAAIISCISVVGTLFDPQLPHTAVLNADLQSRLILILARPIGTLFMVAGVAYILATTMSTAIRRANRAEVIAKLEHEIADQKQSLEAGVQQILQTHVEIANGNLRARAPLNQDSVLWQIANALNNLLVRFQQAVLGAQQLTRVELAVRRYVEIIQDATRRQQSPVLPLSQTPLDPLIVELQGKQIGQQSPLMQANVDARPYPPGPRHANHSTHLDPRNAPPFDPNW